MIVFVLNGVVSALLASAWAYTSGCSLLVSLLLYPVGGVTGMLITLLLHLLTDDETDRAAIGVAARHR